MHISLHDALPQCEVNMSWIRWDPNSIAVHDVGFITQNTELPVHLYLSRMDVSM